MELTRPVWAEVNLEHIRHNFREVRRLTGGSVKVMAVVKANAYGHGAPEVASALRGEGADYFGVALLNEAVQLRKAGIEEPVLILGWTPVQDYKRALDHRITLTIYSLEEAEILSRISIEQGLPARVHLKVDTGMGRLGFQTHDGDPDRILDVLKLPGLEVEGIFTHLAKADEKDKTYTGLQIRRFINLVQWVENTAGYHFRLKHAANSAAIIDHPEAYFDLVRPGIMLYGLNPSSDVRLDKVDLRQAISLRARVSHIKEVPAGTPISYGGRFVTAETSVIATLPLGYADGYSRLLSGKAEVIIGGQRAPLVGRVCMDQIMFNATGLTARVKQGDIVTLIGRDGNNFIPVDELAGILGTINYEVTCAVSARVPRVYQG